MTDSFVCCGIQGCTKLLHLTINALCLTTMSDIETVILHSVPFVTLPKTTKF